jgi:thiamine biosynthesis lipoprotein
MAAILTPEPGPSTDSLVTERRFAAMGTRVHLLVHGGGPDLALSAGQRIDELESRWSRFRAESEVSRLNAAQGEALEVYPDTYRLVQRACQAWHLSDGAFDPTVFAAVAANGYDRSFAHIDVADAAHASTGSAPGCAGIDLDDRGSRVRLPAGVGFDPGGIGKGLAADIVAGQIMRAGARGVLVSIGGDLVALGASPDPGGWTVAIEEPGVGFASPLATISFTEGALATSVTTRRTWMVGDEPRHHLIDPQTGRNHRGPVVLATALACEGWLAEITTKAHVIERVSPALASVPSLIVTADGRAEARSGMDRYLS